jgi:hypothetical protein
MRFNVEPVSTFVAQGHSLQGIQLLVLRASGVALTAIAASSATTTAVSQERRALELFTDWAARYAAAVHERSPHAFCALHVGPGASTPLYTTATTSSSSSSGSSSSSSENAAQFRKLSAAQLSRSQQGGTGASPLLKLIPPGSDVALHLLLRWDYTTAASTTATANAAASAIAYVPCVLRLVYVGRGPHGAGEPLAPLQHERLLYEAVYARAQLARAAEVEVSYLLLSNTVFLCQVYVYSYGAVHLL